MKRRNGTHSSRQKPMSKRERLLLRVLLSLPVHVLALDNTGKILYASSGPRTARHPGVPPIGPRQLGLCYVSGLREAAEQGDGDAAQIAAGVAAVLRGERAHFNLEFTRTVADESHAYLVRVDRIAGPGGGAVVCHIDTTERNHAEAALRDLHDRYAFATLAGGVGLWDLDVRSRDLYVDPSLIELLGFDRSAAGTTVVNWNAITTPEDRAGIRTAVAHCMRGETPNFEVEHQLQGRDGKTHWFLTRGDLVLGSDDKPLRLIGLSTDITARKIAQLVLERERGKYRQIFDDAGVAIWEADFSMVVRWLRRLHGRGEDLPTYLQQNPGLVLRALRSVRVRDVNSEAVRLAGAGSKARLLASPLHALLLDAERHFLQLLVKLAARQSSFEGEAAIRTIAGERRDVVLVVRFPAEAQEFRSVLLCAQDITALVERRRRYELATSAGGVTVFELDLTTRQLRSDPPLHGLLGLDPDQPVAFADLIERMHPEDALRVLNTERAVQTDQAPRDGQGNTPVPDLDFRLLDGPGQYRWFLKRGSVIRDATGRASTLVGTITDITSQIQMEEKVRAGHEQVRQLARRLIAAQEHEQTRIARDLRDGLGARMAGVVSRLGELGELLAGAPPAVRRDVDRLQTDFHDLVDGIASLSRQMHPANLERPQLHLSLRRLCEEFSLAEGLDVTLGFDLDEEATSAAVTLALYRVTQEALRNIVQHAGAERAEVSVSKHDDSIQLRIRDWGRGFQTPDGTPRGLGLLSIQERARLVGGQAYVLSTPGRGTEVRVSVPLSTPLRS
jgi:PAS domain S-box-containing protein